MARGEPMAFAKLDHTSLHNRCGVCMEPYHSHRPRMAGEPTCPKGGTVYRAATEEELDEAYKATFGDGPIEPIATFHKDNPEDMERLKQFLSGVGLG